MFFKVLFLCFFKIVFLYNFVSANVYSFYTEEEEIYQLLESIVVSVGTRGQARSVFDSLVPIEVITSEQISRTGLIELNDVIQRFIPSFSSPRPAITDGTDHVRPVTMRGLGPDQILVLINGKRRYSSSVVYVNGTIGRGSMGVDINAIPVDSVKHIEILKDGAAAQYGSDAIAGIINIVLKDNTYSSITATLSQTGENDGSIIKSNLNFGFDINETGFLNINYEFYNRDYTNRAGLDIRTFNKNNFYYPFNSDDPMNHLYFHNNQNLRHGDPQTKNFSLFVNSHIPVNDNFSLYTFGNIRDRKSEGGGFYRPAYNISQNDTEIYRYGFLPIIAPEISDKSIVLGTKTNFANWDVDLSLSFSENSFDFYVNNSLNRHLGAESPSSFFSGSLQFIQNTINFDLFKEHNVDFLTNPLKIGLGAEFRYENFIQVAGEENSYYTSSDTSLVLYMRAGSFYESASGGFHDTPITIIGAAQVFPGFRPEDEADETRLSTALYFDIENNISDNLLLGFASRFENFTDFGNNFDGKLAFRYNLFHNMIVRGSTSTGFRAPSLGQSHYTKIGTSFHPVSGLPSQTGTFAVEHPLTQELGAKSLKPEKSTHLSAGIAYNSFNNFDFSFDYYFVDIKDRIILSGEFNSSNSPGVKDILDRYGVGAVQFWTNAINTRTIGFDIVSNYTFDLRIDEKIIFSCAFNFNKTEIRHLITKEGLDDETLLSSTERLMIEEGQPNNITHFSANYIRNNLDVFIKVIRAGSFLGRGTSKRHDEQWLTDLNLGYNVTDNFKIDLGGNNIFDSYPEKRPLHVAGLQYDNISPFGFNGVYYYSKMTYNF